jgi:hypothetical protein
MASKYVKASVKISIEFELCSESCRVVRGSQSVQEILFTCDEQRMFVAAALGG